MKIPILFVMFMGSCVGQTPVNGGRDHKGAPVERATDIDFSTTGTMARIKAGRFASRPVACNEGQAYFATDAVAAQNLSSCTTAGSSGTWSPVWGSAATTTTTGRGAPGGRCTLRAMSIDTVNEDLWFCGAADVWKRPAPHTSTFLTSGEMQVAASQAEKVIDSTSREGVPTLRALVSADISNNSADRSDNAAAHKAPAGFNMQAFQIALPQRKSIYSSVHSGFVTYNNFENSLSGIVSYADYSSEAATVYRGPGLATFSEPVSINRVVVSLTAGFQAAAGAHAITSLQLSVGTASNANAYMNPLQVGYQLSTASCEGGLGKFTLASPVPSASQTPIVVVSGVKPANYNGTFGPDQLLTWTRGTTFYALMSCAEYDSGGMASLQGLISGNRATLPQAMKGENTAYLYLRVTDPNPAYFKDNLLAGWVKVMMGGVQLFNVSP